MEKLKLYGQEFANPTDLSSIYLKHIQYLLPLENNRILSVVALDSDTIPFNGFEVAILNKTTGKFDTKELHEHFNISFNEVHGGLSNEEVQNFYEYLGGSEEKFLKLNKH